jgi:phosphoenolpyruvate carboxylase
VREVQDRPGKDAASLAADLARGLEACRAAAGEDAFANPYLLFALRLGRRIDDGDLDLDQIETVTQALTAEAFEARSRRFGHYLGETDPGANHRAMAELFERIAAAGDFDAFRTAVGRAGFGVVFTAHPTFSLREDLAEALVELATGHDVQGRPLDDAGRRARMHLARETPHLPPAELTLDVEHAWSVRALSNALDALNLAYRLALQTARRHWPERWSELEPRLATLSSWVGYDQDGRTDITWMQTLDKRLEVKRLAIERHRSAIGALGAEGGEWGPAVARILAALDGADRTVEQQAALLREAMADPAGVPAFARAMTSGCEKALCDINPLLALIDAAVRAAPDDEAREALLARRAVIAYHGLSLCHVQVRLNSVQLHNAIRREVGLSTAPNDPANRRSYFAAINERIEAARPAEINFGSLMREGASAKRLMMTIAQMVKLVDRQATVRFLIAETESGFTLLTALYYARLFGVEELIDISPLFETEEALDRGEAVIEEALRSPAFVAYLKKRGRLAVQLGYSDSGRFIGQMAATFRIERFKLRLAELMARNGLSDLELVLFDTHGESVGRGGHPDSLADRLRYVAPPASLSEFARRGIRVKQEDSFQGGDGYLPFFTGPAATASLARILEFSLQADPEAEGDPIYEAQDFASEFFATVQQAFSSLVDDPDYAALVGLYGAHILPRTGSRPNLRQDEAGSAPPVMAHVSELRAIPNNAILQAMAYLANVVFGVGRAAAKDAETFAGMLAASPRFRRAMRLVQAALQASDLHALQAYAASVDPDMWLARAGAARREARGRSMEELSQLGEVIGLADRLARVIRRLGRDRIALHRSLDVEEDARRRRLLLVHGLRVALIQRICLLAVEVPEFSPDHGVTRQAIQQRLVRLDEAGAVEQLSVIFPKENADAGEGADFGEPATYRPDPALSYAMEDRDLFRPLLRLHGLILRLGGTLIHDVGALG